MTFTGNPDGKSNEFIPRPVCRRMKISLTEPLAPAFITVENLNNCPETVNI
ncbi:MAG: hypothetical protein WBK43_07920 [Prolixibacteraceae bacterium]|jgi:hypothetical protein|nr:hypothetical protein [Prolixibacteraceae bacterium]HPL44971.1 hypothetical protein [Prolixibacteraceae bacterium]HQE51535.1 hypothetical protein [Prolixibacteraceae bacterium]HQH75902.1 hypothetical protein [Prolixibacteraceae bacterium]HQJ85023.1 hypothetical protein [Prolixibacteraceae bacterium]